MTEPTTPANDQPISDHRTTGEPYLATEMDGEAIERAERQADTPPLAPSVTNASEDTPVSETLTEDLSVQGGE